MFSGCPSRALRVRYNPLMNEHRTTEEQKALDAQYMALALEEARAAGAAGEVPIGAVVVYEPIDRGTRRPLAEPRVIARGAIAARLIAIRPGTRNFSP